jgi:hypothetical protein
MLFFFWLLYLNKDLLYFDLPTLTIKIKNLDRIKMYGTKIKKNYSMCVTLYTPHWTFRLFYSKFCFFYRTLLIIIYLHEIINYSYMPKFHKSVITVG